MCTASRTGLPAYIQSAVTRCEHCASYAATTSKTPTYSFPSAVGQSVLLASTASSSASARLPRCLSRSTRTCFAMPAGSSSPTMATTRGRCSTPRAQEHSAHGQVHRDGARPVQGLLERLTLGLGHLGAAASGRRQARDDFRFPLYHLGIRGCLALRQHLLDKLDPALNLLVRHLLNASAVLDFHVPRHQQDKQFQKYRRLVPHHLLYRLAAVGVPLSPGSRVGVGSSRRCRL